MHPFLERLKERARASRRRIVFPEGEDPRVIEAARRLQEEHLVEPVLVSRSAVPGVESVWPESSPRLPDYAALYHRRRASKGVT